MFCLCRLRCANEEETGDGLAQGRANGTMQTCSGRMTDMPTDSQRTDGAAAIVERPLHGLTTATPRTNDGRFADVSRTKHGRATDKDTIRTCHGLACEQRRCLRLRGGVCDMDTQRTGAADGWMSTWARSGRTADEKRTSGGALLCAVRFA